MSTPSSYRHKHHRFPAEVISHAVWLYFRFCLSYRDVEERLFARGVIVTYEAIPASQSPCQLHVAIKAGFPRFNTKLSLV